MPPAAALDGKITTRGKIMIRHAYAVLSHVGAQIRERIGLEPAPRRAPREQRSSRAVVRVIERLDQSAWTAAALTAAAESGLLDALAGLPEDRSLDVQGLATAARMPPALAAAIADVLVGLGLAVGRGGGYRLASGARGMAAEGVLGGAARATWLQADDFRRRAQAGLLDLNGWRHTDPAIIEAQGAVTRGMAEQALPRLAFLPGLLPSLRRPGAALLDVGAGAAGLSITLCRHFEHLHAVALEPADAPAAVGCRTVREAGLDHRITVRRERAEDLSATAAFDLVFLPQMFLSAEAIEPALGSLFQALKPGGWLLAATVSRPGGELAAAVPRLQSLLWGGNLRDDRQVRDLLRANGFDPVILPPGGGTIRTLCARRPPVRPDVTA
jgi:predicted O-methyltransferase YrrM